MTPVFAKAYNPGEIHFIADDCDDRSEPSQVLLCTPEFYDITESHNIYMHQNRGRVEKEKAAAQWNDLHQIYLALRERKFLEEVHVIHGVEGCEEMVFCANQSVPWTMWNGEKVAVMSHMQAASRQNEIPYFEDFYKDHGYRIVIPQSKYHFEGMGDLIAHPGKRLLYGGYGFRSEKPVYEEIVRILDAPLIMLELINENFYHLDMCFLPLNNTEVMIAPGAFSPESLTAIRMLFEGVYEIPEHEAINGFACNAHILYGPAKNKQVAIIQKNNPVSLNIIQQSTSDVVETNMSEFMKSGGGIFCMKMMVY